MVVRVAGLVGRADDGHVEHAGRSAQFFADLAEACPDVPIMVYGAVFRRNVLAGGDASRYPPNNFFPPSLKDGGFADNGRRLGADIESLKRATAGVLAGTSDRRLR